LLFIFIIIILCWSFHTENYLHVVDRIALPDNVIWCQYSVELKANADVLRDTVMLRADRSSKCDTDRVHYLQCMYIIASD